MILVKMPFENNVEKGQNAVNQAFSPYSTFFLVYQRKVVPLSYPETVICISLPRSLQHNPDLTTLMKKDLKSTVGKGENASNQHFLLLPLCFLLSQREKLSL